MILSDGNDTGSTHSFDSALEEVHRSGAVVYAVDYDASSSDLRRLTDETGGILFDPPGADYSGIISQIEADLRGHYILGFRPKATGTDARHHSLKVEVRRAGATVRARREYSAD